MLSPNKFCFHDSIIILSLQRYRDRPLCVPYIYIHHFLWGLCALYAWQELMSCSQRVFQQEPSLYSLASINSVQGLYYHNCPPLSYLHIYAHTHTHTHSLPCSDQQRYTIRVSWMWQVFPFSLFYWGLHVCSLPPQYGCSIVITITTSFLVQSVKLF